MKKCTERPRNLCSLNGAISVAANIYKCIPILHASPGCSNQASQGTHMYYLGGYHGLVSTNAYEREVVFGGSKRLQETIQGSLEVMKGELFTVITGCSMGINGDDIDSVIREFEDSPYPIIGIDTAGFKGDTYFGYQATLLAIVKTLARKTKTDPRRVNVYGQVPHTDETLRGDIEELDRIFARIGVKLNTFFIKTDGIEQLKNSGNAALNINLSPWMNRNLDSYYEHQFGIPTLHYPGLPIGPTAVEDLLRQVAEALDLDRDLVESVIQDEKQYVYHYFDSMMGTFERLRYILVGESNTVLGYARYLTNDAGHIPLAVIITDSVSDKFKPDIEAEIHKLECDRKADVYYEDDVYLIEQIVGKYKDRATALIGGSYDKVIAKHLNLFFVLATYPCFEKQTLNRSHIGIRGCLTLTEDLYNHY
ncbi:MAG: nitrogen fixation protein NifK [Lachnospiraceae bacterium]|nr:nitrogen fixation protein NifK [Lachnospiraceae bacterium]